MGWFATIALITAAVGTGISAYGQHQAGKTQQNMANLNAQQQARNARAQLLAMQTQANLQRREAQANFHLRSLESRARENNAVSLENQAIGQDRINRANLIKRRQEGARIQSAQRAAIADAGLVESIGTPLDLLAETAATIQQDQEEQAYSFELQRRTLFREASLERLGGQMALAGATLDRNSGLSAARLQSAAAEAEFRSGVRQAEIIRLGGDAARRSANIQASATLFSGLSNATGNYFSSV